MKKVILHLFVLITPIFVMYGCVDSASSDICTINQWTKAEADTWYSKQGWLVGCNYSPSNAINQLEMWQQDTFSPELIDKELGWAKELGFNTMRTYLHSLVWRQDPDGFKKRIDEYLKISTKHGIKTTLVFFDDCWVPEAKIGKQPEPKVGVHNSGWVHDPIVSERVDTVAMYAMMESYVKDVMTTFKDDDRILMWDLYNEPGNTNQLTKSLPLVKKVFQWGREVDPSQPLTVGIWKLDFHEINRVSLESSDIITYHCYLNKSTHQDWIHFLKLYDRPMVCTEWMGRRFESTFETVMPLLKEQNIGALGWGFVAGKTNTIFAWDDPRPNGEEPKLWFHDILRVDGTPYCVKEIETIKSMTLN